MVSFPEITKSRLRQKLLSYFFANSQMDLYVREAALLLKEDAGNLSKELSRLEKDGIFISNTRGKQKYFSLNKEYPLFEELRSVISKTIGIEASLKKVMATDPGIKIAFIYGSFAQDKETNTSDIDLLVIGEPNENNLMDKIDVLEKNLGREINYTIYSEKNFSNKIKSKSSFILNIIKRPKIILKGNLGGF
ncbi:MAG TPA: nucleotidyltransferase domain-containing protein [Candidatus Omnitrophota bacterium]|nr:nucleotidyltransferase domain-containing protein [Candidatus Omnitrophota bacterium]